jgi:hypothetical protein
MPTAQLIDTDNRHAGWCGAKIGFVIRERLTTSYALRTFLCDIDIPSHARE